MEIFTGSGVALVTPFNEDKTINYKALGELLDFQIKNQTDAILVCGTTGEASTLTDEEQLECIRFSAEYVNKRVTLIAGAGSNDTAHGVNLAQMAEKSGADALMLVTPYYNKCTQSGLIKHFTAQAEAVSIPIIIYNVPTRTSLNILPKTVYELSLVPNIVAVKEASGDIVQVSEIARLCGEDFAIYSGNDDYTLPVMSIGGKGVISVIANFIPKQTHEMVSKFLEGDIKESRRLFLEMLPLAKALFAEVSPVPVKAAMNLLGMNVGGCRMPLCEIEENNLALLKQEMKNYGLI